MRTKDQPVSLIAVLVHHYDELVRYAGRVFDGKAANRSAHHVQDLAREAVHEVCEQLLREAPEQHVHVPLAFLRTLSKRRAIDHLRSEVLWQRLAGSMDDYPDSLEQAGAASAEPEHQYYARQQLTLLVQAIESLPPRCQDVFVLHKIHEWPQQQVATHLGISIKTVEKHLRIGVACCRYALSDILPGKQTS